MGLTLRIFLGILTVIAVSCSMEVRESEVPELYWPLPPQKPRIKFVDYILGSLDVTGSRRGKFKRVLFGEEGEVGFTKPVFISAGKDIVYVTDLTGVHVLDFGNKKFSRVGGGILRNPTGIAASSDGRFFVADSALKRIFMVDTTDTMVSISDPPIGNPGGLAVDDAGGRLLAVDVKNHVVNVYTLDGQFLFFFGGRGVEAGQFNYPYDAAVGPDGKIYVVDSGNFRVQVFDRDGKFIRAFGTVGTLPGQFARPKGIDLDSDGNIYVVDGAFSNFQIFDREGRPLLAVGSMGIEPGQFVLPIGIAIDPDDKIYVVDQLNKRLQVFQYLKYSDERPDKGRAKGQSETMGDISGPSE